MSGRDQPEGMGWIVIDNQAVGRLAAEHFRGLGFTRFGFCGVRHIWTSNVRGEAFKDALGDGEYHEIIDRRRRVRDWDAETPELIDWVRGLPKPIAVLATHDDRARQLALACQEGGVSVPEELAILGVNNDELTCEMAHPPLSSIDHNARAMGAQAAAMMHGILQGGRVPEAPALLPPVGVVSRRSTDVLAIGDPVIAKAARLVRERATAGLTVPQLLDELPIGRRALEMGFNKALGRTPHQEILRIRLDHARYLLRDSALDLPAITERCGFKYPSQFSATFRKHEGESPTDYRARHGR